MSAIRTFLGKPRLAQLMRKSGGMYAGEALKRADSTLAAMRDPCLETIDRALARLDALLVGWPGSSEALYELSASVIDVSGAAAEPAVEQAARSLCELLDEAAGSNERRLDAVRVHVASLRLLHRTEAPTETQDAILRGLEAVRLKLSGVEATPDSGARG